MGSSSYITDKNGEVIQHTEYIAFGEVLVDEHSVSNKQPYLFNGKELDYETGLYYYGARYYDPKVSIFLNVDPLVEKTMTAYAYVNNNPINLIDPTGMEAMIPPEDGAGYKIGQVWTDRDGSWTRTQWGWKNNGDGDSYIDSVILTGKTKAQTQSSSLFYRNWSHKQQANIDAARARFGKAEAQCNICQEVKSIERFMFLYMPMTIATGGLNVKGTAMFYAGKASISIGTQVAVNQDVNLVKLAGDTVFNPISGAVFGNSVNISFKSPIPIKKYLLIFSLFIFLFFYCLFFYILIPALFLVMLPLIVFL